MHLKDWNTYSRGSGSLLGHTGIEYLREEKHSKPVLRGNILVTTNLMFDDIANGRYNVSLSEPGANTSASLIYQFDSTKRYNFFFDCFSTGIYFYALCQFEEAAM